MAAAFGAAATGAVMFAIALRVLRRRAAAVRRSWRARRDALERELAR